MIHSSPTQAQISAPDTLKSNQIETSDQICSLYSVGIFSDFLYKVLDITSAEAASHVTDHNPSNTIDGDPKTFYESANNVKFSPWIKFSLAGRHTVGWVVLRNRDDDMCGEYCLKRLVNTRVDLLQSGVLSKTCGVIKGRSGLRVQLKTEKHRRHQM